jgi:hypothetical protein
MWWIYVAIGEVISVPADTVDMKRLLIYGRKPSSQPYFAPFATPTMPAIGWQDIVNSIQSPLSTPRSDSYKQLKLFSSKAGSLGQTPRYK